MKCPECDGIMILRESKYGKFYGCSHFPRCKATHGAHPDGSPLGIPGDKETKLARMEAHSKFDKMFIGDRNKRYKWLREAMNMDSKKAHIAMFNKQQCEELLSKIDQYRKDS